ncbi:AraC family transcriptional regulator [soil metagenome]
MSGYSGNSEKEITKYWSNNDLGDLDCLYAEYSTFSFAPHFHEGFAIAIIERGADVFDYRGAERIAAAGDIMLINPSEVHTGHAIDENGWTFRIMYVDPELMRKVRQEITGKTSDIPFFSKSVVRDDATAQRILRLHRALENSTSHLERESLFLLAMTQLVSRHADSKSNIRKTGNEHAAVARAREYFHANACQNITLEELANIAFLSPFHLLRVFREETGITPHAYQTQIRIERAKRLLRDGFSITQTALATGFFDQSHFSKQFKRYVGISPGKFIAKNKI